MTHREWDILVVRRLKILQNKYFLLDWIMSEAQRIKEGKLHTCHRSHSHFSKQNGQNLMEKCYHLYTHRFRRKDKAFQWPPVTCHLSVVTVDVWCVWNMIWAAVAPQTIGSQCLFCDESLILHVSSACVPGVGFGIVFQEEYQSFCRLSVQLCWRTEGFWRTLHGGAGLQVEGVHREGSRAQTWICEFY